MTDPVRLSAGDLALEIRPDIGGAIAGFRHGAIDLMRPTPAVALERGLVRQLSSYPLLPFSGRVAHGRFSVGGETHQLTLNFGDHPHAIHGNSWQRQWTLAQRTADTATITLAHDPFGFGPSGWDGWPYRYRATQTFQLTASQLTMTIAITNADERIMPAGLGWHPFFPLKPDTWLRFAAKSVWISGPDAMPVSCSDVPEKWNYAAGRPLGEPDLDNVFKGWSGEGEIRFPGDRIGLTITADPLFSFAVVYVPRGRDFFAFEPVSHMADAVNRLDRPDHGLRLLAPGESLSGTMRVRVDQL